MKREDYVSLEVAKLLKEKGFDKRCEQRFVEKIDGTEREGWDDDLCAICEVSDVIYYPKPTLYEAVKWLREKHNIFVVVVPHYSRKYETIEYEYMIATFFDLLDKPYRHKWEKSKEYYEKYQECLNSGIEEALKLI